MRRGVDLGIAKHDGGAWRRSTRSFAKTSEIADEGGCERKRAGERCGTAQREAHPHGRSSVDSEVPEPGVKMRGGAHDKGKKQKESHDKDK